MAFLRGRRVDAAQGLPIVWATILLAGLLLCARPAAASEGPPLLALVPDVRLLPPAQPSPPPWRLLADDPAGAPCDALAVGPGCALASAAPLEGEASAPPPDEPGTAPRGPSRLWTYAIPAGVVAGALANPLLETPYQSFHLANEGWFGRNTYAGGADKAAHFVDYYIISKELSFLYNTLGYSRLRSVGQGAALALLAGIINELGDGINKYGFSYEDLTMDAAGVLTAAVISGLGANDLVGFRRGFLLPAYSSPSCCPAGSVGQAYQNQIFTADLKLAGAANRLNLNVGPLRYLLVSVTYATKGYATGVPDLEERQVGIEIGLNNEEILNALGVRRTTWWGYVLHVVLDNVRVPFTSVGFQYNLNSGRWYGPGNGNSYSSR